jgi:biotin transport system permease protein
MNAGVKLLCLFMFSLAAFLSNPACSAALSAFLAAAALTASLNPASLLRGSRPIIILGVFVALGRTFAISPPFFSVDGLLSGLLFLWGMLLSFCGGALLFAVTTTAELREAVSTAERALFKPLAALLRNAKNPRLEKLRRAATRRAAALYPRTALALSLMMGFIPRFFAEWEALQSAYRARAGGRGIAEIKSLVPLAVGRMIDRAAETAAALLARSGGC